MSPIWGKLACFELVLTTNQANLGYFKGKEPIFSKNCTRFGDILAIDLGISSWLWKFFWGWEIFLTPQRNSFSLGKEISFPWGILSRTRYGSLQQWVLLPRMGQIRLTLVRINLEMPHICPKFPIFKGNQQIFGQIWGISSRIQYSSRKFFLGDGNFFWGWEILFKWVEISFYQGNGSLQMPR